MVTPSIKWVPAQATIHSPKVNRISWRFSWARVASATEIATWGIAIRGSAATSGQISAGLPRQAYWSSNKFELETLETSLSRARRIPNKDKTVASKENELCPRHVAGINI